MPDYLLPWLKAVHFAALLIWSAGLFSMPALFAAHRTSSTPAQATDTRAVMRFTYVAVASPAATIAIASGAALIHPTGAYSGWLALKLALVAVMTGLHILCGRSVVALQDRPRAWPGRYWLALALAPAPPITGVLYLVLAKPF
ncbi:MAG: CopD family protein [Beijerinckiaceae bacterium]